MNPVVAKFKTTDLTFPAGTVGAAFLLTLTEKTTGAVVTGLLPINAPANADGFRLITIANVPPGTYTGSMATVDAASKPIADAVTDPADLVITAVQDVTIAVPSELALTRG